MQKTDIKSNEALPKKLRHLLTDSPAMVGNHHAASSHLHGKKAVQPFTAEFAAKLSRRAQINPNFTAPLPIQPTAIQRGPMSLPVAQNPADTGKTAPTPLAKIATVKIVSPASENPFNNSLPRQVQWPDFDKPRQNATVFVSAHTLPSEMRIALKKYQTASTF